VTRAIDERRIVSHDYTIIKSSKRATTSFAIVMMINAPWNFQHCRNTVISQLVCTPVQTG